MDKEIKELTRQRDVFQSHVESLLQSAGKDQVIKVDQDWASESGVANDPRPGTETAYENLDRTTSSSSISNEHLFKQSENSEDNFLLDGCPPTFGGPDPCQGWEEMTSKAKSEDNCEEVPCIEIKEVETEYKTDINIIPAFEEREENSPMIQVVEIDGKSSSGNGHSDLDAPQQNTEDVKRTNSHLVDLLEKSSDSFESEPRCLDAMSPPETDKVDQENSWQPRFSELKQNVCPLYNKLDQEPTRPHRSDEQELKTVSPPQLDDLEQVSFPSPAGVEKEYSTSLVCSPAKLSEPKLHAKRRKSSRKSSLIHKMNASAEDAESSKDSDNEETASVLNFVVKMNEKAKHKPKSVDSDFDNLMVSTNANSDGVYLSVFFIVIIIIIIIAHDSYCYSNS